MTAASATARAAAGTAPAWPRATIFTATPAATMRPANPASAAPASAASATTSAPGALFGGSARDDAIARHDPDYADWRDRQMSELDRDYDDYRRENQERFDREFGAWREKRGRQRQAVGRVKEDMEVVGSDGGHVGTVDCTRGDHIILTRKDEAAGGLHHAIPCAWVETVDDKVVLNIDADEARRRWQAENRSRALFEREDRGRARPARPQPQLRRHLSRQGMRKGQSRLSPLTSARVSGETGRRGERR